jgi:hypothetical protein
MALRLLTPLKRMLSNIDGISKGQCILLIGLFLL